MKRRITGFHQDAQADWVAELDCHHHQHMRHNPPFTERPWVVSPEGRDGMIGQALDCNACDSLRLPDGLEAYRSTPEFGIDTVPAGLLRDHSTRGGVWGLAEVHAGELLFVFTTPIERRLRLRDGESTAIPPEALHHVALEPDTRFRVTFLRRPADGDVLAAVRDAS